MRSSHQSLLLVYLVCITACTAAPRDIRNLPDNNKDLSNNNKELKNISHPPLQNFQNRSPNQNDELLETVIEMERLREHLKLQRDHQKLEETAADLGIQKVEGEVGSESPPVNVSAHIVDGTPAQRCDWPWMVALTTRDGVFVCGGSLVDREYVLTAAHCVNYYFGDVGLYARLGVHNLTEEEPLQTVEVINITMHTRYNPSDHGYYDIALLKLSEPAATDKYPECIQAIPPATPNTTSHLPPHKQPRDIHPSACLILGWGITDTSTGEISDVLVQKPVVVISNTRCALAWDLSIFFTSQIYPENICVRSEQIMGSTSCQGDSGGPLQCYYEDRGWVLEGVASWGSGACKYYPSVYTRVARFYVWMQAERMANSGV